MRITIIREDGVVGIDGVFRHVDLSAFPAGIRAVQWKETFGEIEYSDSSLENYGFTEIEAFQPYIDLWNAAAPPEPTSEELIAAAIFRINLAYEAAVSELTAGYPQSEIDSWPIQEDEARSWLLDNNAPTPWIDAAAEARGITKESLVALIIANADALAPLHGALTGKRQALRDQIYALGPDATAEQLDAIQW